MYADKVRQRRQTKSSGKKDMINIETLTGQRTKFIADDKYKLIEDISETDSEDEEILQQNSVKAPHTVVTTTAISQDEIGETDDDTVRLINSNNGVIFKNGSL